jgi:hypothetical protein
MRAFYVLALLIAIIGLNGCNNRTIKLSPETAIGTYHGAYLNGTKELFEIQKDGTFNQTLSNGNSVIYSNDGHWHIEKGDIVFENVFLAIDIWNTNHGKPALAQSFRAHWNSRLPSIVFADDENFCVVKSSGQNK